MAFRMLIGIGGGSGSGKTTLSDMLQQVLTPERCGVINIDDYCLDQSGIPESERNYDHPNSYDFPLLHQHVLMLKQGNSVELPIYDFKTHKRTAQTRTFRPHDFVILEGILSLHHPLLRTLCDVKIFVDADDDVRLARRLLRDISERGRTPLQIVNQYFATVKPMYEKYILPCKKIEDVIVVPNNVNKPIYIAPILKRIQERYMASVTYISQRLFFQNRLIAADVQSPSLRLEL